MNRASSLAKRPELPLAVALILCLGLLTACDGSPSPTPTVPTPGNATATLAGGVPETPDLSEALTAFPISSPATAPKEADLEATERVQIYKLAVLALLDREAASTVYISPYVGEGERLDNPNEAAPLPQDLIDALSSAGGNRSYELRDFSEAVGPLEDGGKVEKDGVFVIVGPVIEAGEAADQVAVRASIYRKVGDAAGYIYRVERDAASEEGWTLSDTTREWSEP